VSAAEIKDLLERLAGPEGADRATARHLGDAARRVFPEDIQARWLGNCRMLSDAGLGQAVVLAYARHAPAVAAAVDVETALAMAERVKDLAFTAGRQAALALPAASARAAARLPDAAAFQAWMALVLRLARDMPESMADLLDRTDRILAHLDVHGLEAWAIGGIRAAGGDRERRKAFFGFADPEAERALLRESGEVVYADLDRRLRTYLTALWRMRVVVREAGAVAGRPPPRRTSFDNGIIHVPATFPGVPASQAETLFRASMAHVAAHLMYSGPRFKRGELRPMQIALVSLIEDARVEQLAMREFPGLRRLWLPFHTAGPSGGTTAPAMMARLARALIDPDYQDDDTWISKGRRLFEQRRDDWHDPAISRGIGNLLGNDLGQMRVQFNARTYVVEPAYRDDNTGLWDFADEPPENQEATEIVESVRIAPERTDERTPREDEPEKDPEESPNKARPAEASQEQGVPVARYPEWDYLVGRERDDWTTIVEYPSPPGPAFAIERILERHGEIVRRITALVRSARVSRPQRVRGQHEGEQLDIDACINAVISRRQGNTPDPRVYMTSERRYRDLSVLVLLDVSRSTNDRVKGTTTSVLDLEREATALLAHAMDELGDPFALAAFCSDGREEVRYHRVKDFDAPYGPMSKSALSGLAGDLSTRIGAAMRHAASDLRRQLTHRRLLLVVTDGEPSDIDVQDRKYLVEDARKAVAGLRQEGIDVFCVGLDSGGDSYLTRIFGRRNVMQIDRLDRLPEKLPMLYFRLTA
jgi:hypothetical protein